jgi:hypothetical protein
MLDFNLLSFDSATIFVYGMCRFGPWILPVQQFTLGQLFATSGWKNVCRRERSQLSVEPVR